MGHDHTHPHHATGNISVAFWLNTGFAVLELIGGIYTNSVAITSDALHDFGDSLSLGMAYYFQKKSQRQSDEKYTYGYRRFSLLGAFITSIVLVVGSVFIINEAIGRLGNPEAVDASGMVVLAFIGIAVNGAALLRLKKGNTLSERAVALHFMEDVLGWVAVLIGAVIMMFTNVPWLDPMLSLGIAAFILFNVYQNLRSVLRIALQAVPEEFAEEDIRRRLSIFPEIIDIRDIRAWSLDGHYQIITLCAVIETDRKQSELEKLKQRIKDAVLHNHEGHATIEFELRPEKEKAP